MLQLHTPIQVSDNLIRNNTDDYRRLDLPPLVCPQLLRCRSILSRQREIQRRRSPRRFPTSSQEEKEHRHALCQVNSIYSRLYGHPTICRIIEVNGSKDSIMNSSMGVFCDSKKDKNYPNGVGGCLNHSVDLSRRLSQSYMSWMDFLMIMTLTNRIQKLLKKMNHGMIVLIPNLLSLKKVKSPTKGSKTPPTPALIRSGEFQSSLGTEFPSCVKMTVKSQVTYGFWMESVVPIEDHEFEEEHDSDSTIFHNKNGRI